MSQPITDMIQLSKFDLLNLDADIVLSDTRIELVQHMANSIFTSPVTTKFVILTGDKVSEDYLTENLSISSCFIETYHPVESLGTRLDVAMPAETHLFVWNYFSLPYRDLEPLLQKNWKGKSIYALYLDWTPDQWQFED